MNDCGAPATSESSTFSQSSPTVLSTIAQPCSSGLRSSPRQHEAVRRFPDRHFADVAHEQIAIAGAARWRWQGGARPDRAAEARSDRYGRPVLTRSASGVRTTDDGVSATVWISPASVTSDSASTVRRGRRRAAARRLDAEQAACDVSTIPLRTSTRAPRSAVSNCARVGVARRPAAAARPAAGRARPPSCS